MKKFIGKEYPVLEFEDQFQYITPYQTREKIRFFYNEDNKNEYFIYTPIGKYISQPFISSVAEKVINDIKATSLVYKFILYTDFNDKEASELDQFFQLSNNQISAPYALIEHMTDGMISIANKKNVGSGYFIKKKPSTREIDWINSFVHQTNTSSSFLICLRSHSEQKKFLDFVRTKVEVNKLPKLPYNIWKAIAQATGSIQFKVEREAGNSYIILETTGRATKLEFGWFEHLRNYYLNNITIKNEATVSTSNINSNISLNNYINEREEKSMFNFDFGVYKSNAVRFSPYGLAVYNKGENKYVSYDKNSKDVIDVDIMNFSAENMMYKIPVAISKIAKGDVVLHSGTPVIVTEVYETKIKAIDPSSSEEKTILPIKSPFKFDFITKIVSVVDFSNADATVDSPFGNMLPFLMMGDNKELDPMLIAMMLSGGNLDFDMAANPFMWLMFANNKSKDTSSLLPMMMFMNNSNKKDNKSK